MKITSRILWHGARFFKKHKPYRQVAIGLASLYGINEVFGVEVTLRLFFSAVYDAVKDKLGAKNANAKK